MPEAAATAGTGVLVTGAYGSIGRRTLAHLLGLAPARVRSVTLLPRDRRLLRRALTTLLEHVLEKELPSAAFLMRSLPGVKAGSR